MKTELKTISLDALREYENNPRKNDKAVGAVAESIKQCGYISPIIVNQSLEILAGHTRLKALKKLGRHSVPVLVCEGLTEEQERLFRLLDNKVGEAATWDEEMLRKELDKIDLKGFDFGFLTQDIPIQENEEKSDIKILRIQLHADQQAVLKQAMEMVGPCSETFGNENRHGNEVYEIVKEWLEAQDEI